MRIDPTIGFVLFPDEISLDTLVARGASEAESAYTEAGPIPGHPVVDAGSRWRPQVVGAQSVDLTVRTVRGGFPGRAGAAVTYRLATDEDAEDLRGWNEPNLISDWTAPADGWGAAMSYDRIAGCVIPDTHLMLITAVDTSTGNALTWSFDLRTRTWTTLYDWAAGALDGLEAPIAMAYDAEARRVLLWSGIGTGAGGDADQTAYYSDDGGTTWNIYSRGYLDFDPGDPLDTLMCVVPVPNGDWSMFLNGNVMGGTLGQQYASSDRGVTWERVASGNSMPAVGALGPAGICFAHRNPLTQELGARIIADARAIVTDAAIIDIDPGTTVFSDQLAICADHDGMLYLFAPGDSASDSVGPNNLLVYRSADGGLTWQRYSWGATNCGSATVYPEPWVALPAGGAVYLGITMIGETDTDGTVSLLQLGGWDQVAAGAGVGAEARNGNERVGFAREFPFDGADDANVYFPVALPDDAGWSAVTATGTADIDGQPALLLTTTAGQGQTYEALWDSYGQFAAAHLKVYTVAGSAALADISNASPGVGVIFELGENAGDRFQVEVDVGTDGIRIRDSGSTLGSAAMDTTDEDNPVHIRLHLTRGTITGWWRFDTDTTWTRFVDEEPVGVSVGTGFDRLLFGNRIGEAGIAGWKLVGWVSGGDWRYGVTPIARISDRPGDGVLGHQFGRPLPGRGWTYPIPDGTVAGEDMANLTAVGGPTYFGEIVQLPAGHTFPVSAIFPIASPSPRRRWIATDDSAVRFVWDQGADQSLWWGGAVALMVLNAAPAQWALQHSADGVAWTTFGTLDLTLGSGLSWTRTGRVVYPASGVTIASLIQEGMAVGGFFDLDGDVRRVSKISQGYYSASSAVQQTRIILDGIDGTEATSGSAGALVCPSGVGVFYPSDDNARRFLRVTVASGQACPGGVYGAGVVGIGRVVGLGAAPAWSHTMAQRLARTVQEASDGVTTAAELGPPRRVWSNDWPDGMLLGKIRLLASPADVVAASGGVAIGSMEDASLMLPAIVEHGLGSGKRPCGVISRLPATSGTILDPRLFMLGRLSAEVSVRGRLGTPGSNEIELVGPAQFTELR